MSTDFIGLFDTKVSAASAQWLLERLAVNSSEIAEVTGHYRSQSRVQDWTCEPSPVTGDIELLGPGGFVFRFPPGIVEVYHVLPFGRFAFDDALRTPLRRVWRLVAGHLGSPRAIYTHELMPWSGASLDEVEADLRAQIGPPATNFEELHRAEYFGPHAWYVDQFTDLESR